MHTNEAVNEVQLDVKVETAVTPLDRARTAATAALNYLAEEIERNLCERLEEIDAPARAEISALQAKAAALRESYSSLQPRAESKVRLLAISVDEAVAGGRDDQAEALRAEAAELQANLKNIEAEADRCDARAVHLERQRSKDVEIAFRAGYRDARCATVEESTAVAALLDRTWNSLCRFDVGNDRLTVGLSGIRHRVNLTPDDRGPEKEAFTSLVKWFGFGGRTR